MFVLGLIFYYALNYKKRIQCSFDFGNFDDGNHLYGKPSDREKKIMNNTRVWKQRRIDDKMVIQMIRDMTDADLNKRPGTDSILKHPYFWSIENIADFFQRADKTLQNLTSTDKARKKIERSQTFAKFIGNWKAKLGVNSLDTKIEDGNSLKMLVAFITFKVNVQINLLCFLIIFFYFL